MTKTANTTANSYALLDEQDVEYGQLKILQSSTPIVTNGNAEAGKIFHTINEKSYEQLELVLLGVRKEFRVWTGDSISSYPRYLSDDMKTLVELDPRTGKKIGEEPLEQSEAWIKRKENKYAKTQYFFLAAIPKEKAIAFLRVGGLGYKKARKFLNQARATGKELYQFVTKIGVESANTAFGTKFLPRFAMTDIPVSDENQRKLMPVCRNFIQQTRKTLPSARH